MTLAVWWSGVLMFVTSLACYERASQSSGDTVAAWSFFAIVFVGFAVDEMASIHERLLSNWGIVIPLLLAGGVGVVGALWKLSQKDGMRLNALFLLIGIGLMASAAPQEYLEHSINWKELPRPKLLWNLRLGMEEGSEIFGALLCLIGAVGRGSEAGRFGGLASSIPNPLNMNGLLYAVVISFLIHVAVVFLLFSHVEIGNRRDPFIVYTSLNFVVTFALSLWVSKGRNNSYTKYIKHSIFLLMSLFSFYFISPSTEISGGYFRAKILIFSFFIFITMYLVVIYTSNTDSKYVYSGLFLSYFLVAISFFVETAFGDYILFGLLSLVVFSIEVAVTRKTLASAQLTPSWSVSSGHASQ